MERFNAYYVPDIVLFNSDQKFFSAVRVDVASTYFTT
jgi:hypothetical protein